MVLATVALGSASKYVGPPHEHWGGGQGPIGMAQGEPLKVVEQPITTERATVREGKQIAVYYDQDWSPIEVHGTAVRQSGPMYVATHRGKAVLTAHRGSDQFKYTITVLPAVH